MTDPRAQAPVLIEANETAKVLKRCLPLSEHNGYCFCDGPDTTGEHRAFCPELILRKFEEAIRDAALSTEIANNTPELLLATKNLLRSIKALGLDPVDGNYCSIVEQAEIAIEKASGGSKALPAALPAGRPQEPILCESTDCNLDRSGHRNPATCFGVYESPTDPLRFACDTCCGHGCEDGWCKPIAELADHARRWYGETEAFAEQMEDGRIQHAMVCAERDNLKEQLAAGRGAQGEALREFCCHMFEECGQHDVDCAAPRPTQGQEPTLAELLELPKGYIALPKAEYDEMRERLGMPPIGVPAAAPAERFPQQEPRPVKDTIGDTLLDQCRWFVEILEVHGLPGDQPIRQLIATLRHQLPAERSPHAEDVPE